MKKIENNFTVSGFVGKDAEIRQFANASVARFSLAVGRQEKNGEETNRVSAFMNMEAWRKNEHTESFDKLTKGTLLTVEGFFKPEEWTDKDGVKHSRIIMVATKFYECPDKDSVSTSSSPCNVGGMFTWLSLRKSRPSQQPRKARNSLSSP